MEKTSSGWDSGRSRGQMENIDLGLIDSGERVAKTKAKEEGKMTKGQGRRDTEGIVLKN